MNKLLIIASFCMAALFSFAQTSITTPYEYDFNNEAGFTDIWSIENSNVSGDGENSGFWIYSPDYFGIDGSGSVVFIPYHSNPGDDWVFSPGLELEADANYNLSFQYCTLFTGYADNLAVYVGTSASSVDMITEITDFGSYSNTSFSEYNTTISVATSGVYYIGFHEYGPGGNYGGQTIDDFSIINLNTMNLLERNYRTGVYPNPVRDFLQFTDGDYSSFKIYNSLGEIVISSNIGNDLNMITTANLNNGSYFIQLLDKTNNSNVFRFSVVR
jgi:hypothetical protein